MFDDESEWQRLVRSEQKRAWGAGINGEKKLFSVRLCCQCRSKGSLLEGKYCHED